MRFTGEPTPFRALHIYGDSYWNERTINIQTGLDGHTPQAVSATAYNGFVAGKTPFESRPPGTQLKVLYREHPLGSSNRTILTLHGGAEDFGVSIDDLIERKAIYVKAFGIFLGDAAVGEDFAAYRDSGASQPGEDIMSRVSRHPEQTLDQALGEIPPWPSAPGISHHRLRFVALGFPTSREKYGLDFNGNVFISKTSSKAMKEDLSRMLWQGDQITFAWVPVHHRIFANGS